MGAVVRAHSVGLHVLLQLCVWVMSLVAANVVETVYLTVSLPAWELTSCVHVG